MQWRRLNNPNMKPHNPDHYWTTQQDSDLKAHIEAGLTFDDVSQKISGKTTQACRYRWNVLTNPKRPWSEKEDRALTTHQEAGLTWRDISKRLPGRTTKECSKQWHKLEPKPSQRNWSESEDNFLKLLRSQGLSWKAISEKLPGRTEPACRLRAKALNLPIDLRVTKTPFRDNWSHEEETLLLTRRSEGLTFSEISRLLEERSEIACVKHYRSLMNPKGKVSMKGGTLGLAWIECEENKLQDMRRNGHTYPEISHELGRTSQACLQRDGLLRQISPVEWTPEQDRQLVFAILKECCVPYNSTLLPNLLPGEATKRWEELKRKEGWYETDWRVVDLMLSGDVVYPSPAERGRWTSILATAEAVHKGSSTAEHRDQFAFGLLQNVIDRLTCKKCNKMFKEGLAAHELVCTHEDFSICVDCGERIDIPELLIQHYASRHNCDIRNITIEAHWARKNQHLFPQLDLHSGYGRYLTTRSPVSGPHADREVKKLWSTFSTNPMALEGEEKWDLIQKHRKSFEALFNATPVRFHQHVSDINPPSIHSLLQTLQGESSYKTNVLTASKTSPNFACTEGSFGSCYGGGANTSSYEKARSTACGLPYVEIQTIGKSAISIEEQLMLARKKGCFALIVETVRWKDGRVMLPNEWSNIREACIKSDVVLIVDETLTLLRCGKPFAFQRAEYGGRPDMAFFGKGLNTAGVALDWQGPWLSKLKLTEASREEGYTNLQIVSDILETGCAIRSLGIIRLALQENWAERSLRIGEILENFARRSSDGKATEDIDIQGLGCLLYLKARDVFHHSVQSASGGTGAVRWIPVLDNDMEDITKLQTKLFGPLSITHRRLLGHKLSALGMLPSTCSNCGDHCPREGAVFCSQCCIAVCEFCKDGAPHYCIQSD